MALGTATLVDATGHSRRACFIDSLSFAGDSAYPTGGTAAFEAYVKAKLAVGAIDVVACVGQDCGGYVPCYDKTADKLKVFYSNSDSADGPLIEVTDTTNLSGVTFHVLVLSK